METIRPNTNDKAWNLSFQEIEARKRWQEVSVEEEKLVIEVGRLVSNKVDDLMEHMYEHFLAFPQTQKFFPDQATLERAQKAQAQYFIRLTQGNYDEQYVRDRLRVGTTHYRIGLDPQWYLGAYRRALSWYRKQLSEQYSNDAQKLLALMNALTKVVFFDMSLAIDSYMYAKEEAIKQHRDSIAELEAERRATKGILENAPIGIVHLDLNFECVETNQEFLEMIEGTGRESIIGINLFNIMPHLSAEPFDQVLASGQPYRKMAVPLNLTKEDGIPSTYWDWAIWPIKDEKGNISGIVTQFVSATDRVLLQQQREDFVATLTHDLKTPILAANRAIKLLIEGDFGPVSEEQSNILGTIHQSNESLYNLVQTLLDVYRYDSGVIQLTLQPNDLSMIISNLVDELQSYAKTKNIDLIAKLPAEPEEVSCDAGEIKRVIQNLLDNALKYTPNGGNVSISLEQKDGIATVKVQDTGKGISDEDKPKLFQRFWQAASSGRYYASTGLGLYLSRKIVELHSGRIWCDSALNKGSTFGFTIAIDKAAES